MVVVNWLFCISREKLGMAIAATTPSTAMSMRSSIIVNPRCVVDLRMNQLPEYFFMFIEYESTKKPPGVLDKWRFRKDER